MVELQIRQVAAHRKTKLMLFFKLFLVFIHFIWPLVQYNVGKLQYVSQHQLYFISRGQPPWQPLGNPRFPLAKPSKQSQQITKYLYIQSTKVYVFSSELELPQPLSRKRVCPPPGPKGGGGHTPAAKGVGEFQFRRLERKLSTLCLYYVQQLASLVAIW